MKRLDRQGTGRPGNRRGLGPARQAEIWFELGRKIAAGSGPAELTATRQELARKYRLRPERIDAASAHIRIKAHQALKAHGIDDKAWVDPLVALWSKHFEANDPEVRSAHLARFRDAFERGAAPDPAALLQTFLSLQPPALRALQAGDEADDVGGVAARGAGVRGEDADYRSSRVKHAWGQRKIDYLRANIPPALLSGAETLMLAGKHPEPEIQRYDALGVPRGKMLSVEGGTDLTRVEAGIHARRQGIQFRPGRLIDVLHAPDIRTRQFRIADIDLIGQFEAGLADTLVSIPLAKRAWCAITTKGNRESPAAQDRLRQAAQHWDFWGAGLKPAFQAHYQRPEEMDLTTLRERALEHIITDALSIPRPGQSAWVRSFDPERDWSGVDAVRPWRDLCRKALDAGGNFAVHLERVIAAESGMQEQSYRARLWHDFLEVGVLGARTVTRRARYKYRSEISAQKSPFYALFCESSVADFDVDAAKHSARFIRAGAARVAAEILRGHTTTELSIQLVNRRGERLPLAVFSAFWTEAAIKIDRASSGWAHTSGSLLKTLGLKDNELWLRIDNDDACRVSVRQLIADTIAFGLWRDQFSRETSETPPEWELIEPQEGPQAPG